jgi:hypothetical protein
VPLALFVCWFACWFVWIVIMMIRFPFVAKSGLFWTDEWEREKEREVKDWHRHHRPF